MNQLRRDARADVKSQMNVCDKIRYGRFIICDTRSTYVLASARVRMCACMFAWPEYNGIELAGELVSVGFGWCAKSIVENLRSRFRRKKHCNGTS